MSNPDYKKYKSGFPFGTLRLDGNIVEKEQVYAWAVKYGYVGGLHNFYSYSMPAYELIVKNGHKLEKSLGCAGGFNDGWINIGESSAGQLAIGSCGVII